MLFKLGFYKQPHGGRQGASAEKCESPGFGEYPKERKSFKKKKSAFWNNLEKQKT